LREEAKDVDVYLSTETCVRLSKVEGFKVLVVKGRPEVKWLEKGLVDIRDTGYECEMLDGWNVQSLESVLKLKLGLNREKDQEDIRKIRERLS
jgi:hypothetical protein